MGKFLNRIRDAVDNNRFVVTWHADERCEERGVTVWPLVGRRERRKRWVQRGQYAVEVEVDVLCPVDDPSEPCLEPETVRFLDEVARKAAEGDLEYLHKVGRVFQAVAQ
jgi:hypothetical protein